MNKVTLELLNLFKTIPAPFVFNWFKHSKNIAIRFSENEVLYIYLNKDKLISIDNSCYSFLIQHNIKEGDFFNLALKLRDLMPLIPSHDFALLFRHYLIKPIDNSIYLVDDFIHDFKFIDLNNNFPPSLNPKKIEFLDE